MASTVTNSVLRYVPRILEPKQKHHDKSTLKNKQPDNSTKAESVTSAVDITKLYTTVDNLPASYNLKGNTFVTVVLQDPVQNKNNVIEFLNVSGYMHEVTGTLPNIFKTNDQHYSCLEFTAMTGSYIKLMSDGSHYNIIKAIGINKSV